jgi:hypothetical protein
MIFVFGSNEAGIHGAGAAREAFLRHGAQPGQGFGPMNRFDVRGQPTCFGIPTKDWRIETLPIDFIEPYVQRFIVFARFNPNLNFKVTQIGCGLAGIPPLIMASMFKYAPDNCFFDEAWEIHFTAAGRKKQFWGTHP